ncbi:MAG: hypothetical protein ACRDRX_08265 [Pseudonocardiaceae bacterium]
MIRQPQLDHQLGVPDPPLHRDHHVGDLAALVMVEHLHQALAQRGEQAAGHQVPGHPRAGDHPVAPALGEHRVGGHEPPPAQHRPAATFPLVALCTPRSTASSTLPAATATPAITNHTHHVTL